jgi:hypothetical protein
MLSGDGAWRMVNHRHTGRRTDVWSEPGQQGRGRRSGREKHATVTGAKPINVDKALRWIGCSKY